jgi:hypothetical protein
MTDSLGMFQRDSKVHAVDIRHKHNLHTPTTNLKVYLYMGH